MAGIEIKSYHIRKFSRHGDIVKFGRLNVIQWPLYCMIHHREKITNYGSS